MKTGKALSEEMYQILDATFEGVNAAQNRNGTGKSFSYKLEAVVPKKDSKIVQLNEKPQEKTTYAFTVMIREMGYGERELQTFNFERPKELDRFTMEARVMMSMIAIFTEHALLQWYELGKMLNVDPELQEAAKNA